MEVNYFKNSGFGSQPDKYDKQIYAYLLSALVPWIGFIGSLIFIVIYLLIIIISFFKNYLKKNLIMTSYFLIKTI